MSPASSNRGQRPAPSGSTATRGMIVVFSTLFIGVLLMIRGGGGDVDATAAAIGESPKGSTTTTAKGQDPAGAPATLTPPPAQMKVLIVNGTGKQGVAKTEAGKLKFIGFTNTDFATATGDQTNSIIRYTDGFEEHAKTIAKAMGFAVDRVTPMGDVTQVPVKDIAGANVVVVLAPDAPALAGAASPNPNPPAAAVTTTTAKK